MSDSRNGHELTPVWLLLMAAALLLADSGGGDGAASDAEPAPFPWQGLLVLGAVVVVGLIIVGVVLAVRDHINYKHYLQADAAWQEKHGDANAVEIGRNEDGSVVVHAMRPQDPTNRHGVRYY